MLTYQLNVDEVFGVINILFKLKEGKTDQIPLTPITVLLHITRFKNCWGYGSVPMSACSECCR